MRADDAIRLTYDRDAAPLQDEYAPLFDSAPTSPCCQPPAATPHPQCTCVSHACTQVHGAALAGDACYLLQDDIMQLCTQRCMQSVAREASLPSLGLACAPPTPCPRCLVVSERKEYVIVGEHSLSGLASSVSAVPAPCARTATGAPLQQLLQFANQKSSKKRREATHHPIVLLIHTAHSNPLAAGTHRPP